MRPALQHDDPLAEPLDLGHVVGGEQHGCAALAAIALELGAHPVGGIGIERGGRLVEQQHLRLVEQRLGEPTRVFWPAESLPWAGRGTR